MRHATRSAAFPLMKRHILAHPRSLPAHLHHAHGICPSRPAAGVFIATLAGDCNTLHILSCIPLTYHHIHRHIPPYTAIYRHAAFPPASSELDSPHIPPYTAIYRHIPPYTAIYRRSSIPPGPSQLYSPHSPPYTAIYRHIPPYTAIYRPSAPCSSRYLPLATRGRCLHRDIGR